MHAERHRAGADARSTAGVRAPAVVIAGAPATGKTTLGAAVAGALHYAFIDLDIVTGTLTRAALSLAGADETALHGELGDRLRDARYGALIETAAANLSLGLGVVLSGPFTRERADAARWEELRSRLGAPDAALVCLELDEALRRHRMQARGARRDRGMAGADTERTTAGSAGPPDAIRLDAAPPPPALLADALRALGARDAERADPGRSPAAAPARAVPGPPPC